MEKSGKTPKIDEKSEANILEFLGILWFLGFFGYFKDSFLYFKGFLEFFPELTIHKLNAFQNLISVYLCFELINEIIFTLIDSVMKRLENK